MPSVVSTRRPQGPGVYVVATTAEGVMAENLGAARLDELRSAGAWTATTRGRGRSLLIAAVPDGVARVEGVLARGRSPFTDRRYATAPRLGGAVVDNVVAIPVDRPVGDAWMTAQTWRAPDGSEIPSRMPSRGFFITNAW